MAFLLYVSIVFSASRKLYLLIHLLYDAELIIGVTIVAVAVVVTIIILVVSVMIYALRQQKKRLVITIRFTYIYV